ncbi:CDR ABC transporter-domain-containing protein [Mycena floridula]|nr:CDR ABC transporter-domain-containing protein [Mycena floridula]
MTGGLRWISYLNPLRWGFDRSPLDIGVSYPEWQLLICPHSSRYESVALSNQVCTVVGAQPGQSFVDGRRFTELSFGYSYSNTWRNFAIIIAALLVFTEIKTVSSSQTSIVQFLKRSDAKRKDTELNDEEALPEKLPVTPGADRVEPLFKEDSPVTTDIFTWQNVSYTVPIPGGQTRKLLSDVSGYVVPGGSPLLWVNPALARRRFSMFLLNVSTSVSFPEIGLSMAKACLAISKHKRATVSKLTHHVGSTTVREALLFSAKLRQPASVLLAEKEA